ncbi:hypothetical protein O6H91_08G083800 [Diphasiastrum complanatum]|uniref:Uncharacterized protein n=1 Tax=Diphasiastrum complanatum TaxID=34168 RepID=A0ACC2CZD9_DIPCM|nr:hypothetical protein O6H91_08G083800 [Diphasiastrum complanatum]
MAIGRSLRLKLQLISELWMRTARENPSFSIVVIFIVTILPWFAGCLLPPMRFLFWKFAPQIFWRRVVESLTQSVLFLLVNVVILLIWLTSESSGESCTADTAAIKDENHRLMWASSKESSPRVLPVLRDTTPLASPLISIPPALHPSKLSSQCLRVLGSKEQISLTSCAGIVGEIVKEQKPASSQKKKFAQRQAPAKQPESMADRASEEFEATINARKRSSSTVDLKSAEEAVKIKLTKRSATFTQTASRVIVRDHVSTDKAIAMECGMSRKEAKALVIEKDELNERIEAFFAKFREQLRQESLRHY